MWPRRESSWSICVKGDMIIVLYYIISIIRSHLLSLYGDYHVHECAFMSPVTILFLNCVRLVKVFVMSLYSVGLSCLVVSLYGMYVFVR